MHTTIDHGTIAVCVVPTCEHATIIDSNLPRQGVTYVTPQLCVPCIRAISFYKEVTLLQDGAAALAVEAVLMERHRQRSRWSEEHDDAHTMEDWVRMVEDESNRYDEEELVGLGEEERASQIAHSAYVRTTAVGLAALESLIRQGIDDVPDPFA